MLYGNGIDMAYIPEFQEVLDDPNSFFIGKHFTEQEIEYCRNGGPRRAASRLAARYAVKEAFLKAVDGPRLHQEAAFIPDYRQIEVRNDEYGRPFLRFHDALKEYLREVGIVRSLVTISHTGDYAVAQVLLET